MRRTVYLLLASTIMAGCNQAGDEQATAPSAEPAHADQPARPVSQQEMEAKIVELIEQLVFADDDAGDAPKINPNLQIADADGNSDRTAASSDQAEAERMKFETCQDAFNQLYELGAVAIPYLAKHLDDPRQSINFRNHYEGNSVGDACYWNIHFQLQDRPSDYSRYGYSRKGRDGKDHPKPYWEGTPFDDAGGLRAWLEQNKDLNHVEMKIKCLQWLLEREKRIGAADPDSYFLNILPLEIRILERRLENGEEVKDELERLISVRDNRQEDQIPKDLLPAN